MRTSSLQQLRILHDQPHVRFGSEDAPLHSDALVRFVATRDLAYKQVSPALSQLAKEHRLGAPSGAICDLRSARTLDHDQTLRRVFLESAIFRIDHHLGNEPADERALALVGQEEHSWS